MLHVIYRSYGGENTKGRPDFYSKLNSLMSFIECFQQIKSDDAEIIFLNDGPIPQDRLRIMEKWGEVVARSNLGGRGSIRSALGIPGARGWPDDDLVWFSEDDYLYRREALNDLIVAAEAFPDASYFALYAMIGSRQPNGTASEDRLPAPLPGSEATLVHGHPWRRAVSTTGTFGARVKPLLEDRSMLELAATCGGAWDHTMCLMYQGFMPFPLSHLMASLLDANATKSWLHRLGIFSARMLLNSYQAARPRRRSSRRILVAPDPPLITHVETSFLALGTNWRSVAEDAQQRMVAEYG